MYKVKKGKLSEMAGRKIMGLRLSARVVRRREMLWSPDCSFI